MFDKQNTAAGSPTSDLWKAASDSSSTLFFLYISEFFLPKPIAWTLPQVVGTNPLPTYYQEPRASLTAWWCIIETKSSHVAKTSH